MKNRYRVKNGAITKWLLVFLFISLIVPLGSWADSDPKDGLPGPDGGDAFLLYYRNASGNEYNIDGNSVSKKVDFTSSIIMARYAHFVKLNDKWDFTFNILAPVGTAKLDFGGVDERASGLADPSLCGVLYFTSRKDNDGNRFTSVISAYLTPPLGEYRNDKSVNMGTNRWAVKIETLPVVWQYKRFLLELGGNVSIYTDNDGYTVNNLKLSQDPLFCSIAHLSYDITKTFWIAASHYYHGGGKTAINDVDQDNDPGRHTAMFTAGVMPTPQTQLLLQYAKDIDIKNGIPTDSFQLRWAYFW